MKDPSDAELASRICLALMRVGTRMAVGFDQHFVAFGLTQAQFRLLIAVWNCGGKDGATPTTLSEYLFLERATVSVLLKRLLVEGLLERHPETDRRSYRVTLTEKGSSALWALLPHAQDVADTILGPFAITDLHRFEEYLKALEERLRSDAREPLE